MHRGELWRVQAGPVVYMYVRILFGTMSTSEVAKDPSGRQHTKASTAPERSLLSIREARRCLGCVEPVLDQDQMWG
jgi:hypothetical protein